MGEGESMGPLNSKMKEQMQKGQTDIKFNVEWNTLGEYLNWLEKKESPVTLLLLLVPPQSRQFVVGEDDRDPTPAQMDSMKLLVRQAMEEGAMGVGSSLISSTGFFCEDK